MFTFFLICPDKVLNAAVIRLFYIVGEKTRGKFSLLQMIVQAFTTDAFLGTRLISAIAPLFVFFYLTFLHQHSSSLRMVIASPDDVGGSNPLRPPYGEATHEASQYQYASNLVILTRLECSSLHLCDFNLDSNDISHVLVRMTSPTLQPKCLATTAHLALNRKNIGRFSSAKASKLPCPLLIINSASR